MEFIELQNQLNQLYKYVSNSLIGKEIKIQKPLSVFTAPVIKEYLLDVILCIVTTIFLLQCSLKLNRNIPEHGRDPSFSTNQGILCLI